MSPLASGCVTSDLRLYHLWRQTVSPLASGRTTSGLRLCHLWPQAVPPLASGCVISGLRLHHLWPQAVSSLASGCTTSGLRLCHLWPQAAPPLASGRTTSGLRLHHLWPQAVPPLASGHRPRSSSPQVQRQSSSKAQYSSTFDCARQVYRRGGLRNLYLGTTATIVRGGSISSVCITYQLHPSLSLLCALCGHHWIF